MTPSSTEESLSLEDIVSVCKRIGLEVEISAKVVKVSGY